MIRSWRKAAIRRVWEGARRGQWAMSVNGPWRICFRFEKGDAYDVEVINYHK